MAPSASASGWRGSTASLTPFSVPRIVFTSTLLPRGSSRMPTYEYRCPKCGKHFSKVESIEVHGRKRPACPKCKSAQVEQVLSAFYAKTVKKS